MARQDMYTTATDNVITMLETAGKDWSKSWTIKGNCNVVTGKPYQGINAFMIAYAPFSSPFWGTYKQWASKECQVQKGEKGTDIIFFNYIQKKNKDGSIFINDNGSQESFPLLRGYKIFNFDQVEGKWTPPEEKEIDENIRFDHVDYYVANTEAEIQHGQDQAFYSPLSDYIGMPDLEQFKDSESYYSVLLHELMHWTKTEKRCNRLNERFEKRMGKEHSYAFEELVAELGSIFLGIELKVQATPQPTNAKYLNSWLERLKQDKRFIFSASSYAQKAVTFCNKLQESKTKEKVA